MKSENDDAPREEGNGVTDTGAGEVPRPAAAHTLENTQGT